MPELLLAPESRPFAFAAILLVFLGLAELLALLAGASLSGLFDHGGGFDGDIDADAGGLADVWLGWLHVGKVPLLVLLAILLTAFALAGFAFNAAGRALLGAYPPAALSAPAAFLCALPAVRALGGVLARLIPKDETSAVTLDTLVGHVAIIVNGTARAGYPAQAKVKTEQGQTFYIHVEPDGGAGEFQAGDSVLLVKQLSGARFQGIANPRPDLL